MTTQLLAPLGLWVPGPYYHSCAEGAVGGCNINVPPPDDDPDQRRSWGVLAEMQDHPIVLDVGMSDEQWAKLTVQRDATAQLFAAAPILAEAAQIGLEICELALGGRVPPPKMAARAAHLLAFAVAHAKGERHA